MRDRLFERRAESMSRRTVGGDSFDVVAQDGTPGRATLDGDHVVVRLRGSNVIVRLVVRVREPIAPVVSAERLVAAEEELRAATAEVERLRSVRDGVVL